MHGMGRVKRTSPNLLLKYLPDKICLANQYFFHDIYQGILKRKEKAIYYVNNQEHLQISMSKF